LLALVLLFYYICTYCLLSCCVPFT